MSEKKNWFYPLRQENFYEFHLSHQTFLVRTTRLLVPSSQNNEILVTF